MKRLLLMALVGISLGLATPVYAQTHEIDYEQSGITFAGTHAGNAFSGQFEEWSAKIEFFPEVLEDSVFEATFQTASVETGNAMYDGTLPQKDWFNSKEFPEARFEATQITKGEVDGEYTANGNLTIRDITQPVSFDFFVSDPNVAPVRAEANFTLDRLAFDIGRGSDANAEWVSREIDLKLIIIATPVGE